MENFEGLYTSATLKPCNTVAVDTISLLLHMKNLKFSQTQHQRYECFTTCLCTMCVPIALGG